VNDVREIKSRAMDVLTGEWVYGAYLKHQKTTLNPLGQKEVVEYHQGCFMVDDDVLGAIHTFSEIKGNIYENPELRESD
jgi:hypothetical protein